jgi:hypothetical protein
MFAICQGEATYFLGMKVTRDRESKDSEADAKKLTGELLARYGMEAAKGKNVPTSPGEKTVKEGEPLDREKFQYSELVGSYST